MWVTDLAESVWASPIEEAAKKIPAHDTMYLKTSCNRCIFSIPIPSLFIHAPRNFYGFTLV
jgi:hypothetical protein